MVKHHYSKNKKNHNSCDVDFKFLFQHWIRMEMHPDILIHRLYMRVEPTDSSYMPSVVVISGGETLSSMKEIRTVNISSSETMVTLLLDMNEVVEIDS